MTLYRWRQILINELGFENSDVETQPPADIPREGDVEMDLPPDVPNENEIENQQLPEISTLR